MGTFVTLVSSGQEARALQIHKNRLEGNENSWRRPTGFAFLTKEGAWHRQRQREPQIAAHSGSWLVLQFEELKSESEPISGFSSTFKGWKDVVESKSWERNPKLMAAKSTGFPPETKHGALGALAVLRNRQADKWNASFSSEPLTQHLWRYASSILIACLLGLQRGGKIQHWLEQTTAILGFWVGLCLSLVKRL